MLMWLPVAKPTADNSTQLFICQAWHELLHPQTPDSFRARVLDLSLILDDMLHVADVAATDSRWSNYLPDMADELEAQLDAEQRIIPAGSPNHRAIAAVIEDAKHSRSGRLRPKILIAKGMFGRVEARLCDDARVLINENKLKKSAILDRLSTIASHVCYRAMSNDSFKLISPNLLDLTPTEVLDQLVSPIQSPEQKFNCTFAVSGDADQVSSILSTTTFKRVKKKDVARSVEMTRWSQGHSNCIFFSLEKLARSAYSAAESSLQELDEALNVHNLFTNSPLYRSRSEVFITTTEGFTTRIEVAPSSHFGLMPRTNAVKLTKDRLNNVGTRLQGRLANALECHATAIGAEDPRTAIINLWTALEAIAGSHGATSIGLRVSSAISPIIASRRIDKIITYLSICVHDVAVQKKTFIDTSIMTRSSHTTISNDDMLEAVTGPAENEKIRYLFSFSEPSPLLVQRLYLSWKAFSDPARVSKDLISSKKRVQWQISRIYRARNLLVHRGEHSHLVWRLLQNAQYYVSASLSRVLHDLSDQREWGIDESLTYQEMHLNYICERLDKGQGITHRDALGGRSNSPDQIVWKLT